jgi:plasmid stabilization system protein ParE
VREVFWSEAALADLAGIIDYIANDNPKAALAVIDRIEETGSGLGEMATGRAGRVAGTYERLVVGMPCILAYAIDRRPARAERIVVLRVIHARRDWRDGEWPENRRS